MMTSTSNRQTSNGQGTMASGITAFDGPVDAPGIDEPIAEETYELLPSGD